MLEYLKALKEEVGMLGAVEEARKVLSGLLGLESAKSDRPEPGKELAPAVDFNALAATQDFRASASVVSPANGHADQTPVATASS